MHEHLNLISSNSETGTLVANLDWQSTPLGPMETWPQSLKTSLSICLACRFPILLWWGPEMVLLYNDDYMQILGNKHPASMGGIGREVWADVWPVVGPMLEEVRSTSRAVKAEDLLLIMNRYGYEEETYFSFSYSPILDETGGVGGIFTPVIETTEKVISPRRIETLRLLAAQSRAPDLESACIATATTLSSNSFDVPFGLFYKLNEGLTSASLVASFGGEDHPSLALRSIAIPTDGCPWLLSEAIAGDNHIQVVSGIDGKFPSVPSGKWLSPVHTAIVCRIVPAGQTRPVAIMVLGVSPHRELDTAYRSFYDLLVDGFGSVVDDTLAYQAECKRLEAMAEIDRAKTAFFSNISHEFRTPLTLMLGPLEELTQDPSLPAPAKAELSLLRRNGARLLKLVNTLLDFSRIEAGRMQAKFEPTDLPAFTAELASVFRSAVEKAGLRLIVSCPPLPQPVRVDRGMWEKIVLNLISNAFKFTLEGEIKVALEAIGDRIVLSVSDTGAGIESGELPRLFERFYRIEGVQARTHEGSGIGLALVHDLVRLHGGRIEAESRLGEGSTFTVAIPAKADPDADGPMAAAVPLRTSLSDAFADEAHLWLTTGDAPPSSGLDHFDNAAGRAHPVTGRVLIVDDNADMRDYVCRLLQAGREVRSAENGKEALAAIAAWRPDIIVSDIMMPVMGGYELLAAIRGNEQTKDISFVLLSARAGEEARIDGMEAGADDYIVKPFSNRELVARVESLILKSRMRAAEAMHARRMQAIFAQAPVGIAILRGPEHVYELANPVYQALIGHRQVVGMPIRQTLPELAGQGVYELLDDVFNTAKPYVGHALQVEMQHASGEALKDCYFDFVYQPMLDSRGQVEGICVVCFDVTELSMARRSAEIANRAKDEFMAMLGHELRNPLAPIMTAVQLMRLRGIPAVEKERQVIERQASHLVRLVDDLLNVSRITQGKVQLMKQRVEVSSIVAKSVETVAPLIKEKSHLIDVQVPADGLLLEVDPYRFTQIISNLLTNAAKYSDTGSRITVIAKRENDEIVIEVRDTGHGISSDLLPKVFDLFVQGMQSPDRAAGGLGLGLSIAKSIVNLHGGTIHAESPGPGKGSVFIVRMPVPAPARGKAEEEISPGNQAKENANRSYSILVVDDNADAAATLAEILEVHGHVVDVAPDGFTALRIAQERAPEIALLDIGLPDMDGYELARRLRDMPSLRSTRLLALTGYGQSSDRAKSIDAGFEKHLVKPLNLVELHKVLDNQAR